MVLSFALLPSECIREDVMDTMLFKCKRKICFRPSHACVDSFSIAGTGLQCLQKKWVARLLRKQVLVPSAGQTLQKSVNLVFSFTLGMQGTLR